jgi:hypothetical protein
MRVVKATILGLALAAFTAGTALACSGHPGGHAQTDKPAQDQSTASGDKKS